MIQVYKKDRESSLQVVRRFSKIIKRSGALRDAKKRKYFQRPKSEQLKKESALKKEELREKYRELKKMGKLKKF